jgi:hypothetical protein
VKLTTHLHLVARSRILGAIPPFPQYAFMAWCSVKAQGQLYLYLYFKIKVQLVKEFPVFSGTRRFVSCSQGPNIRSERELLEYSPYCSNIHFNIILPSTSMPPKWSIAFRLSKQNSVGISHLSYESYMSRPSHPP